MALYDNNGNYIIKPENIKPQDFLSKISEPTLFVGDGALKYKEMIQKNNDHQFAALHQHLPLASITLSMIIEQNLAEGLQYDFDAISHLEPYYLRKSQAELAKINKK